MLGVQVIRARDHHRIDRLVFDDRLRSGKRSRVKIGCHGLGSLGCDIKHRCHGAAGHFAGEGNRVRCADIPRTNDAYPNSHGGHCGPSLSMHPLALLLPRAWVLE